MKDRFRFRVWNIKEKEMIYNAEIAYDGMNYNTKWQLGKNQNDGWVDCFGYYLDYPDEYEVMQCTGLKDKNGKLIYEGDIVKEHYYNTKETTIKKVFFDKNVIGFAYTDGIEYNQLSITDEHRLQVIGNIYQNKELLNENT